MVLLQLCVYKLKLTLQPLAMHMEAVKHVKAALVMQLVTILVTIGDLAFAVFH
jgi:hypothetical protein